MAQDQAVEAPTHLAPETKRWWLKVCGDYELSEHHQRLLQLAAESWDRCQEAREALAEHGTVYIDRFGSPRVRPEAGIERDSRLAFARLLREIGLDESMPEEARIPRLAGGRR